MTLFFYLAFASTLFCGAALLFSATSQERLRTGKRIRQVTADALYVDPRTARKKRAAEIFERTIRGLRTRIGLSENERLRQRFLSTGPKGAENRTLFCRANAGTRTRHSCRKLYPFEYVLLGDSHGGRGVPDTGFLPGARHQGAAGANPPKHPGCSGPPRNLRGCRPRTGPGHVASGSGVEHQSPGNQPGFMQINREQRAGKPRMEAWQSMADRTKVPDIAAFTSMLVQTEKFGTPIARALSTFADGIRRNGGCARKRWRQRRPSK